MKQAKERKGFNFYKSYFDVYKELSKNDKLLFIDALLDRQFNGVEPTELKGMVKFAYISQKHNIDRQVKGFEDKTGVKLQPTDNQTSNPPCLGGTQPPLVQGEEKEKEKEKGEIPTLEEFKTYALLQEPNLVIRDLEFKYKSWKANDWKDGNNKKVTNWKAKLLNTIPYLKVNSLSESVETPAEALARKRKEADRF